MLEVSFKAKILVKTRSALAIILVPMHNDTVILYIIKNNFIA